MRLLLEISSIAFSNNRENCYELQIIKLPCPSSREFRVNIESSRVIFCREKKIEKKERKAGIKLPKIYQLQPKL